MNAKNKQTNVKLLNMVFAVWLLSEVLFAYTIISRLALLLFVGTALLLSRTFTWSRALTSYGLLIAWSLINVYTGHAADRSFAISMTETLVLNFIFLFAFCCYCRCVPSLRHITNIYKLVAGVFCAICVVGGLGSIMSGERISTFGINSNVIASMAAFASIMAFNDYCEKVLGKKRYIELILIALFLITILVSGSRKGLIIPIVGIYALVCMKKPRRFILYTLLVAVLAVAVLFLLLKVDVLYNLVGYRVEPVLQYLGAEAYDEASMDTRIDYVELGWLKSWEQPLWGHGLDSFKTLKKSYGVYSHCNYIELLYSLGWIGIAIYYLPYAVSLLKAPKVFKKARKYAGLAVAILVPYIICEYFRVTYFSRTDLMLPFLAMMLLDKRGIGDEFKEIC